MGKNIIIVQGLIGILVFLAGLMIAGTVLIIINNRAENSMVNQSVPRSITPGIKK